MKCLWCNGDRGEYVAVLWKGPGGGEYRECGLCDGTGKISLIRWLRIKRSRK